jgi:ribosomal-protein-alanine N-acetyltransferase
MDLNTSVLIRPGAKADLPEIVRMQSAAETASQWNPEDYLAQECLVAECGGRVAGFIVVRRISPDESEILNVAVAPEFRRQGMAKRLVQCALETHTGSVYLEVRQSNLAARKLYESRGFHQISRREKYYSDPVEAAIVMKFRSC